jgi:hypothetical protein
MVMSPAAPVRVHLNCTPHTRAQGAADSSELSELRRAERPGRAGAAAADRRRHFFLADCCSQIRGDDGARPIGAIDDDVGGRRRASAASYGVIDNRSENLQH